MNIGNLIPITPYLLIVVFILSALFKKNKWLVPAIVSFCFSSSPLLFKFIESDIAKQGHFIVGINIGMYASVVITVPLAIYGWILGNKISIAKSIVLSIIALVFNLSVVKTYQYAINKNTKLIKKEISFNCEKLPYHCAIKTKNLEKIPEFKKLGYDIEARDSMSRTPLWYALTNKEAVEKLLKNGAKPDSINIYGETPLATVLVINITPNIEIAQLLINHGANINRTVGFRKKISILNFAIVSKNIPAINFALKNRANPMIPDDYKKTPCQRLLSFSKEQIENLDSYCTQ